MLVLSRKAFEGLVINGNIRVQVRRIRGNRVRLAIDAPPDVRISREKPQLPDTVHRDEPSR